MAQLWQIYSTPLAPSRLAIPPRLYSRQATDSYYGDPGARSSEEIKNALGAPPRWGGGAPTQLQARMGSLPGGREPSSSSGAADWRGGVAPVFVYFGTHAPPAVFKGDVFSTPRADASAAPDLLAGAGAGAGPPAPLVPARYTRTARLCIKAWPA